LHARTFSAYIESADSMILHKPAPYPYPI